MVITVWQALEASTAAEEAAAAKDRALMEAQQVHRHGRPPHSDGGIGGAYRAP